jgi:hypothetical protein
MKTRLDVVRFSSVLYSLSLLCLVRAALWHALAGIDNNALTALDAGYRAEAQTASNLGIASLAMILIGLIVLWTGYVKRSRSAWLVMFLIAWLWAFPLFVLPLFRGRVVLSFSEWIYDAIYQSGFGRLSVESILIFLAMMVALALPIRSFFFAQEQPSRELSLRLALKFGAAVALLVIGLLVWIHLRTYEIPNDALNSWQQLPSPQPPNPCLMQRPTEGD